MPETLAALRYLGLTLLSQGHLVEARPHLEEVLRTYDPNRDREAQFRFGTDSLASATIYLAHAYWQLGDVKRARELQRRGRRAGCRISSRSDFGQRLVIQNGFRIVSRRRRSDEARCGSS